MFRKSIALWTVIALLVLCFVPAAPALEPTTLCHGMQGEEVRELQQALIDLGYLKGTADGIFGNKTEIAVRKFQKKNKLSADGCFALYRIGKIIFFDIERGKNTSDI